MYKLIKNPVSGMTNVVNKIDGNIILSIPFDPANTDYQAYLEWIAEGNTPEEAE